MREEDSALYSLGQAKTAMEMAHAFLMTEIVRRNTDIQVLSTLVRETVNLVQGVSLVMESVEMESEKKEAP